MQKTTISGMEAHESTQYWKEQSEKQWSQCVEDIIHQKPFGNHPFYIFMIVKRVDDKLGIKRMIHQPRLTKPHPVPGTTLLRVHPVEGKGEIIWTLPNEAEFPLYGYGKMYGDPFIYECIQKYLHHPEYLMKKEQGDLSDAEIAEIYKGRYHATSHRSAAPSPSPVENGIKN